MKGFASCLPVLVLVVFTVALLAPTVRSAPVKSAYFYYGSGFASANINATLFSHLFYGFVQMNSSFMVQPASDDGGQIATFSATVRRSNPSVKTLLSIGGGGSDSAAFSNMVASAISRQTFINSCISLARRYRFDGLDLDWEYPQSSTDMNNLATLFSQWRTAITAENSSAPLLLSAAVRYNVTVLYVGAGTYPVQAIAKNLDWVNLMCYDYHGTWEPTQTGEHTALYESDPNGNLNTNYGVTNWLAAGLPSSKVVMGLAMYGYNWYLQNASNHGVGAPAKGIGPGGGVYTYDQIQQFVTSSGATCVDDSTTKSAYCYGSTSGGVVWVGFDDTTTIDIKVKYLLSKKLGGYVFWNVASDQKAVLALQAYKSVSGVSISQSIFEREARDVI